MSYFSELDGEVRQMAGGINGCSEATLKSMSTQDLRDLFQIFTKAAKHYSKDRDQQLATLITIRDEMGRRCDR